MENKEKKTVKFEQLQFKVDCEWLCNFVRQRVYHEGVPYTEGLKMLKTSFNMITDETADEILKGKKKIVGINSGTLEDDNKYEEYLRYLKRNEKYLELLKLREDVSLNPYKYFDVWAASWSATAFEREHISPIELSEIEKYFLKHESEDHSVLDLSETIFKGGCYSIYNAEIYIKQPVESAKEYWAVLYNYWNEQLKDENNWQYSPSEIACIEKRQRNFEIYIECLEEEKTIERQINIGIVLSKMESDKIRKIGKYTMYDGSLDADVLNDCKYLPTDVFSEYGIISPTGDFYACSFACHAQACMKICDQNKIDLNLRKDCRLSEDYGIAKDKLYDLGWVFVNTVGANMFYHKYDEDDIPQKVMDTMFDYDIWTRTKGAHDEE